MRFAVKILILALVFLLAGCEKELVTTPQTQTSTQPTTAPVTTVVPTTVPSTTVPPTTVPPTTVPSTTVPSTTVPTTTVPPTTVPPTTASPTTVPITTVPVETVPTIQGGVPHKLTVEAPGILEKRGSGAVIDYSNTQDGYVMVCFAEPCQQRLKVQVKGPTTTYTYNLSPEKWTAFPLSDENGAYQVTVYQNVTGSKYAALLSVQLKVTLSDPFAPFLRSNQYVDFDAAPNAVAQAYRLTAAIATPLQKVEAIYDYVVQTLRYDRELAATVQSGYLPVLDQVLAQKKGICFDYAALMTGMLRSQGIPTKLVVGYAGQAYHAWISVWTEETGWIDGVIFFDGNRWHRMDPTFASSGSSADILDYIGDGANYVAKYFY